MTFVASFASWVSDTLQSAQIRCLCSSVTAAARVFSFVTFLITLRSGSSGLVFCASMAPSSMHAP